ncbi:MAG: hypothetical protein AB8C46_21365 [Burkholderiaceae bacterium]
MKFIKYVAIATVICFGIYAVIWLLSSSEYARSVAIISTPLALWTARLIVTFRTGVITRRMRMLDGGPLAAGQFFSFRPDVYIRKPGFDNFKGYAIKESFFCLLGWVLVLSPVLIQILQNYGFDV